MTPAQCRAARAMIGLSQDELAEKSQVAKRTIASYENETRIPYPRTLSALQSALEAEGIVISDDGGINFSGDRLVRAHLARHPEIREQFRSWRHFWIPQIPRSFVNAYREAMSREFDCRLEIAFIELGEWSEYVVFDPAASGNDHDALREIALLKANCF
ncbi:helix-turn-helix domain-containing protein [Paracoccus yeei]|uniref:helix-turn-helix domain-containing protein n=1 Tax=Paracoccus yeei TaxID=147645 RepID=UPI0037CEFF44